MFCTNYFFCNKKNPEKKASPQGPPLPSVGLRASTLSVVLSHCHHLWVRVCVLRCAIRLQESILPLPMAIMRSHLDVHNDVEKILLAPLVRLGTSKLLPPSGSSSVNILIETWRVVPLILTATLRPPETTRAPKSLQLVAPSCTQRDRSANPVV